MSVFVLLVLMVVLAMVVVKVRRFRLTGQALRADRQPQGPWSGRYPRSPFRRGGRL